MITQQLSVFVENKKGRLAAIASQLSANQINIRALSLADTTDFGVLRLITDDSERAKEVLASAGIVSKITNVLAIGMADAPGGAAKILSLLSDADVAIEYLYACTTRQDGRAVLYLHVDRPEDAQKILEENGYEGA
jgi:hypothetical protein